MTIQGSRLVSSEVIDNRPTSGIMVSAACSMKLDWNSSIDMRVRGMIRVEKPTASATISKR